MKYLAIVVLVVLLVIAGVFLFRKGMVNTLPSISPNSQQTPAANTNGTNSVNVIPSEAITNVNQITLEVALPQDRSTVTTATITVAGKTSPNADVFINDKQLVADSQGNFSTQLTLDQGDNEIAIVANDQNGNSSEKDLTVTLQTPGQ